MIAFEILLRVVREQAFAANLLASSLTDNLSGEDRALTHELVLGVLRQQRRLDHQLISLSGRTPAKLDLEVLIALRIGLYQLQFLTRIPARAAVNESVNLIKVSRKSSAAGFANAVLRKATQTDLAQLGNEIIDAGERAALLTSHPAWLFRRWVKRDGLEWATSLAAANNSPAPLNFRLNLLKQREAETLLKLAQAGLEIEPSAMIPNSYRLVSGSSASLLTLAAAGALHIQDEASQLVATLLEVAPGMKVLDACAAPGGKTTLLAAMMNNRGLIIAGDLHPARLRLVEENCQRLQVSIISTCAFDAGQSLPFSADYQFDRILIDAPCSGTGTLRRNPEIKWRLSPEKITEMAILQAGMLENCAGRLKTGGRLVYSTCSLETEEDERVVKTFLAQHPEFQPATLNLPAPLQTPDGFIRTWPQRDNCDGFFAAALVKQA